MCNTSQPVSKRSLTQPTQRKKIDILVVGQLANSVDQATVRRRIENRFPVLASDDAWSFCSGEQLIEDMDFGHLEGIERIGQFFDLAVFNLRRKCQRRDALLDTWISRAQDLKSR